MSNEGMLPPPRKQQLATNADFRKLLETPRRDRTPSLQSTPRSNNNNSNKTDAQKQKKRPPRPKPEPETAKEDEGPSYRDRADERRKGVNPDYERVAVDLSGISGGGLNTVFNQISVEDSKFLGGDVDHTHLVKGLDYALLQKVRGELKDDDAVATEEVAQKAAIDPEVIKFKSAAGRAIYNSLFRREKLPVVDFSLSGRTGFIYDLETPYSSDIPTTLRRSAADCPQVVERVKGGMDATVLERMVKIMSYMRGTSGKPGKLKKKEKLRMLQMLDGMANNKAAQSTQAEKAAPASGPADADNDIFGDAGREFEIDVTRSRGSVEADKEVLPPPPPPLPPSETGVGPARPVAGYNSAAAAYAAYGDVIEPPPPPPAPAAPQVGDEEDLELDRLAGLAPEAVPPPPPSDASKAQGTAAAQVVARDTEDAYEECYPDYGGFTGAVVDSDEEDLGHMDTKEGKSRYEFETEEQWEKYKSNKEMLPKAAFQFGVKMGDGRKGHKQLGKGVEQKERKQLRKIQGMLNDSHGDRYSSAFSEGEKLKATPGPSKRRRI